MLRGRGMGYWNLNRKEWDNTYIQMLYTKLRRQTWNLESSFLQVLIRLQLVFKSLLLVFIYISLEFWKQPGGQGSLSGKILQTFTTAVCLLLTLPLIFITGYGDAKLCPNRSYALTVLFLTPIVDQKSNLFIVGRTVTQVIRTILFFPCGFTGMRRPCGQVPHSILLWFWLHATITSW